MNRKTVIIIVVSILFSTLFLYILRVFTLSHTIPQPSSTDVPSPIALSLEDLVGQRFIWGVTGPSLSSESAKLITTTHAGGVIIMGELTSTEIASLTAQIQALPHTLPIIIAIDQEGGTVKRMMDDENPGGYELGTMDADAFCSTVSQTNTKLAQAGVNTNFGIIGDIGWFPNAYITNRTYGNTVESVLAKTSRAIDCSKLILTTIKHFPGHGRTLLNSHLAIPTIQTSLDEWLISDARPFLKAIPQGVDFIMFGHLRYTAIASEPATLSPYFHEFVHNHGFEGLTITDDLGMLENAGLNSIQTMKQAFESGNDELLYVTSKEDPYCLFQESLLYATSSSQIYNSFQEHYSHIQTFKEKKLTN